MAERRAGDLRGGSGLAQLLSVLVANVAMATFVSLGVVADEALGATPLVFVAAGLVFMLTGAAYMEGITMLPSAGGAPGLARRSLGELWSFFAAWALLLDYLILVALTAYFAVHYIGSIPGMSWLIRGWVDAAAAGVLILVLALQSMRGIRFGPRLGSLLALVALLAQVLLALIGVALVFDPSVIAASIDIGVTPSWGELLFALPIAMIGFAGLDTVANLAGGMDARRRRLIVGPLVWAAATSVMLFVTMSVVALSALPVTGRGVAASTPLGRADGWVDRPVIGILRALELGPAIEPLARTLLGLLAAIVLLMAANSATAGMSRVAYFMSANRQAPSMLFSIDRTGVPRRALLLMSLVAVALLAVTVSVSESAVVLAQLYAFGATLSATIVGLSILRLRISEPELPRPWRAPLNVRVAGRSLPLTVVLGTAASLALWTIVLTTHDAARVVGLGWMVSGFVAYAIYRLTHGLSILDRADPLDRTRIEIDARTYRRVLVAVRPEPGTLAGGGDAEIVGLAYKLLDERIASSAQVTVMLVHELPLTQELDAPLHEVEQRTVDRLGRIRVAASTLDLRITSSIARARAAGRAICQEASRREVDAVLLATRSRTRPSDASFGRCISFVVRHAPCDVIVLMIPETSSRQEG